MLKRIIERIRGHSFRDGGFVGCSPNDDFLAAPGASPHLEKGWVRIVSNGQAQGTKIYVDGREIPRVSSIEIGEILPDGLVSAKIGLIAVQLDMAADIGLMEVVVDGLSEKRPVQSVDTLIGIDGTEHASMKRPMLYHGEHAIYYMDGSPPTIISEPQ